MSEGPTPQLGEASNPAFMYFNGVNGATGQYLVKPRPVTEVAGLAHREMPESPEGAALVKRVAQKLRSAGTKLGPDFDVDETQISQIGWAVVFATDTPAEIRTAVQPLIDHRKRQVPPDRCKVLEYRTGKEGVREWLQRNGASTGQITATRVPYYVLLVGDPGAIPFEFQYLLDIEYAVGRLAFERPEQYRQYAESVIDYETARSVPNSKEAVYWATRHNSLDATQMSADWLAAPLYEGLPASGDDAAQPAVAQILQYRSRLLKGKDATKANLMEVLHAPGAASRPALLFAASHGLGWPRTHASHQRAQGALLCQDYPVGDPLAGLMQPSDYLAAEDIANDARLHGLVAFLFACFGAGTPEFNNFLYDGDQGINFLFDSSARPERIAERAFLSPLPQRLLAHPQGGALAVIGHIERAWGYSIRPLDQDFRPVASVRPQLGPFRNCLGRILKGEPVGHATKDIGEKYALYAAELLTKLDKGNTGPAPSEADLAWTWVERNDARNYILLGDPAVRLRVPLLQ
jgi:hypothetical protein